jgi:hypothetical protein
LLKQEFKEMKKEFKEYKEFQEEGPGVRIQAPTARQVTQAASCTP